MNRKVALVVLGGLGAAFTLAVVGLAVFLFTRQAAQPASDEEAITERFWELRADATKKLKAYNQRDEILNIEVEGNWATLEFGGVYLDTGEAVPAGPGLMIFRKVSGRWEGEIMGTPLFKTWVEEIPESLIPPEVKDHFR